jgi:hypothetical protein
MLACVGCGGSTPTLSLHTNLASALQGCNRAGLGDMAATLDVSGHEPCTLHVADDLVVQGDCTVTIGTVRSLGLSYALQEMTLAYVIGWVDLTKDALGEDATELTVDLTGVGNTSAQVDTDAELDALPGDNDSCPSAAGATRHLCEAKKWARQRLEKAGTSFNVSADGTSNLVAACNPGA